MEAKPRALWFPKLIKLAIQQPIRIPSSWATVTDLAASGMVPRKDYQLHHQDAIWEGRPQVGGLSSSAVQTVQQGRAQSAMACFCKNLGLRYCGCVKTANQSLIPCRRNNNKFQLAVSYAVNYTFSYASSYTSSYTSNYAVSYTVSYVQEGSSRLQKVLKRFKNKGRYRVFISNCIL